MRQRVGFARALVVEPDALLMDEPFSALDVLTAENLRTELLEPVGAAPTSRPRPCCIVTHNIEEAVLLADRVFVLGVQPRAASEPRSPIDLPRPRDRRVARVRGAGRPDLRDHDRHGPEQRRGREPSRRRTRPWPRRPSCRCPTRPSAGWPACSRSSPPAAARRPARAGRASSPSRSTTCCPSSTPPSCSASPRSTTPTSSSPTRQASGRRPTSSRTKELFADASLRTGAARAAPSSRALASHQRRHPQRALLPRPARPRLHRGGRPRPARHRHRLGPLRRAVRLRRRHRRARAHPTRLTQRAESTNRAAQHGHT